MNKLYSSRLFQFAIIILISLLCVLLNALTKIRLENFELPKDKPEYNAWGAIANVYNRLGKLMYSIRSEHAWQYPANDRLYLRDVNFNVYREHTDAVKYNIVSKEGWIDYNKKIAFLGAATIMTASGDEKHKAIKLIGQNMDINMNDNSVTSKNDVLVLSGENKIAAHGFSYNNDSGFLVLNSHVKIKYYLDAGGDEGKI